MLRGKATDKTRQHGHDALSTFGVGADVSEARWRGVLRQLIALGHVRADGEFHTLSLDESARGVLRGETRLQLRVPTEVRRSRRPSPRGAERPPPLPLDEVGLQHFAALKAWRAEVASEHNLPAYVVFHDATLAEMARSRPDTLESLSGISGVGAKKLQAYGQEILRVLQQ